MSAFRKFLNEGKDDISFEVLSSDGKVSFTTHSGDSADQVTRKLKTKKFQAVINDLKITRRDRDGREDVTKLFIK
jgi:hypothetical protein